MQALSPRVVLTKPLNRPKPVILSSSWGNYVGRYEARGSNVSAAIPKTLRYEPGSRMKFTIKAVPQKWYTPPSQFEQSATRLYRVGWLSEPVHNELVIWERVLHRAFAALSLKRRRRG